MKIGLFEIHREPYRFAKIEWLLYKIFGVKRKIPCGRTKHDKYMCCCQPFETKYCDVINEGKTHEVVCKVCGETKIMSSNFIEDNDEEWIKI